MKPVLSVFDGFFVDADSVYEKIIDGKFEDFESPWDGVKYPGINKSLPPSVKDYVVNRMGMLIGEPVQVVAIFARVTSTETGGAPHRIHCDRLMSQYSAHVYLSKDWPAEAGTSFWTHKTEGPMQTDTTDVERIMADTHSPEAWDMAFACQGRFNRILIHDSRLWHSAEPAGGWGSTQKDGRVVLTCFFNVGGN